MELLKNLDKEQRMKRCYELCDSVNWEVKRLYKKTDLQVFEIRDYVKEYIDIVLKRPLKKEEIWFIIEAKDKLIFNYYNDIIKLMLREKVISYEQIRDADWLSNNLRNTICKFCYKLKEKFNWVPRDVKKYCEQNNINYTSVNALTHEYIERILKWDMKTKGTHLEMIQDNTIKRNREELRKNPSGYAKILTDVLNAESEADVIRIIEESGKNFYSLKHYIGDFLMVYHDNSDVVKNNLLSKWKIYEDYFNEKKKDVVEQQLKEKEEQKQQRDLKLLVVAREIIEKYIDGGYKKVADLCADLDMDRHVFDRYVNIIKEYDEQLYNKYIKKVESLQSSRFATVLSKANKVLQLLKEGINENGVIREFNLIDYYSCTNLTFDELFDVLKGKLNTPDYRIIRTFIAKNQNDKQMSPNDIANLYNTKTIVGAQFDKKGNIIPGTGREIIKEEKQAIIKYLNSNNIPVTNKTYNIIYRRWLSGELDIEKPKTK